MDGITQSREDYLKQTRLLFNEMKLILDDGITTKTIRGHMVNEAEFDNLCNIIFCAVVFPNTASAATFCPANRCQYYYGD